MSLYSDSSIGYSFLETVFVNVQPNKCGVEICAVDIQLLRITESKIKEKTRSN